MKGFKEFLIETTKYWFKFNHIPNVKNGVTDSFNLLEKNLTEDEQDDVYLDPSYDYKKPKNKVNNKITGQDSFQKAYTVLAHYYTDIKLKGLTFNYKVKIEETKDNKKIYKDVLIEFKLSGGNTGSGKLGVYGTTAKVPQTWQQEQGTIEYFLSNFKGKSITLKEINKKVGFEFDDTWYHNFEQQYISFISNKGETPFNKHKIFLDSVKNNSDVIVDIAKNLGLQDSKDNWNPADIWIMNKTPTQIKSETKEMISLAQYNAYLEEQFNNNSIVGVSLKKVGAKSSGKYTEVTPKNLPEFNNGIKTIPFNPYNTYFLVKTGGNVNGFNVKLGTRAGKVNSMDKVVIYLEGTMEKAKVQMGAISKKLFMSEAKKLGFDIQKMKTVAKKNPGNYFKSNIHKIFNNNLVNNIGNIDLEDLPNDPIKLYKADVMCMYCNLYISTRGKKLDELLKMNFYSAMKLNSFSSIYCKLS